MRVNNADVLISYLDTFYMYCTNTSNIIYSIFHPPIPIFLLANDTRRPCLSSTGTNFKASASRSSPLGTMKFTAASERRRRSSTTPSVLSSANVRARSIQCVAPRLTPRPMTGAMRGISTVTRENSAWRGWRRGRLGAGTRISRGRTLELLVLRHRKR